MAHAPRSTSQRFRGYSVHVLTASGVAFAFVAAAELMRRDAPPDARWVFVWLLAAGAVDAIDGPLARAWHVKHWAPALDGRTIDDIVDYLTFTFVPLVLVWRMGWLPDGFGWTVAFAMIASLLGFAHCEAKDETGGFFRGFPSYWNLYAFYAGLFSTVWSEWLSAVTLWILTALTIAPIRMIYPNLAPRPWRTPVLAGTVLWLVLLGAMLPGYPEAAHWVVLVSLAYPVAYAVLSAHLSRRASAHGAPAAR